MKTKLRTLSFLLVMLVIFAAFPAVLHAEGGESPFEGSGTVDDPYLISTPADFKALTDLMNGSTSSSSPYGAGKFFRQTADIDMTDYTGYEGTHAGDSSVGKLYFGGIYNGAGHTLTVNLNTTGQTSIFPYVTGVILNLKFAGTMTGNSSTQPIRTIQAGAVIANVVVEMSIISNGGVGCGLCYSQYGTLLNVFVTGVARSKAVYNTNDGGQYYHVFTNVTKSTDGSALTHSTCTASSDLDAIAAAFNDHEDAAFTSGVSALSMACMDLTEEALGTVTVANGALVLSDGVIGGGSVQTLSGSGTQTDPYLIDSPAAFKLLTDYMNASTSSAAPYGAGCFFLQTEDIDMTGYEGYDATHVLNDSRKVYFGGIYNGCGHTLTVNLVSEGQTSVFPYVTGAILNLKITGSIDSGTATSTSSAQPIRAMQAGSVIANCVFEMTLDASYANGVAYSSYGTMFNVYTTGVAKTAVYRTNSGGKYYHVFTNSTNAEGAPITHSTCTATDDLDAIAAAFNNREDEDFTSGIAALNAVNSALTEDELLPVHREGDVLAFGAGEVSALVLGVYENVFTTVEGGVNKATFIGSIVCGPFDPEEIDCVQATLEFRNDAGELVKTKTVEIHGVYRTLNGYASVADETATAQGVAKIDADYLFGVTVQGIPAGSYRVSVAFEALVSGESAAAATPAAPMEFEF